jgi:hypothetical protein
MPAVTPHIPLDCLCKASVTRRAPSQPTIGRTANLVGYPVAPVVYFRSEAEQHLFSSLLQRLLSAFPAASSSTGNTAARAAIHDACAGAVRSRLLACEDGEGNGSAEDGSNRDRDGDNGAGTACGTIEKYLCSSPPLPFLSIIEGGSISAQCAPLALSTTAFSERW